jgi:hypothetical protein
MTTITEHNNDVEQDDAMQGVPMPARPVDDPTVLDEMNELERSIQLDGARDPQNFRMPDGSTMEEFQRRQLEVQREEGLKDSRRNDERMKELYHSSYQPLPSGQGQVVTTEQGIVLDQSLSRTTTDSSPTYEVTIPVKIENPSSPANAAQPAASKIGPGTPLTQEPQESASASRKVGVPTTPIAGDKQ